MDVGAFEGNPFLVADGCHGQTRRHLFIHLSSLCWRVLLRFKLSKKRDDQLFRDWQAVRLGSVAKQVEERLQKQRQGNWCGGGRQCDGALEA